MKKILILLIVSFVVSNSAEAQFKDDWVSGIYTAKYKGSLKKIMICKKNEFITGRIISYVQKWGNQVDKEFKFESNDSDKNPIVYDGENKILRIKVLKSNGRYDIMSIILTPKKSNKFIVSTTTRASSYRELYKIRWKDLKMERDITSPEFIAFMNSDENDKILRKSKNNKYPLYYGYGYNVTAPFKDSKDLTEKSEVSAYVSAGRENLIEKTHNQKRFFRREAYYPYYGDNIVLKLNKNISSIKRDVQKNLPNIKKIYLSFTEKDSAIITIDFDFDQAFLTNYGIKQRDNKNYAEKLLKQKQIDRKKQEYTNLFRRLQLNINEVNKYSNLPDNLKITSTQWLNMLIQSVQKNQELDLLRNPKKFINQLGGVKENETDKIADLISILKRIEKGYLFGDIKTLKEFVKLYNQKNNLIENNKNIASMLRGYVFSLSESCSLKNEKTKRITYTKTTNVKEDKYFGLLYSGSSSKDYTSITNVVVPLRFYESYTSIENKNYKTGPIKGNLFFTQLMKEFIFNFGCKSIKTKHLDQTLLKVYKERLEN